MVFRNTNVILASLEGFGRNAKSHKKYQRKTSPTRTWAMMQRKKKDMRQQEEEPEIKLWFSSSFNCHGGQINLNCEGEKIDDLISESFNDFCELLSTCLPTIDFPVSEPLPILERPYCCIMSFGY